MVRQPDGVTPAFNLLEPFPQGLAQPVGNSLGLHFRKTPYQRHWSFDTQRQLPRAIMIEIDCITHPSSTLSQPTVQYAQLLRPYPQFTAVNQVVAPVGFSSYNALELKVERRFAQGLALVFNWTHAKSIDNHGASAMIPGNWAVAEISSPDNTNTFAIGLFRPATFVITHQFQSGNVSRYLPDVRNPSNFGLSALIEKQLLLHERLFNATNSVNFARPQTAVTSSAFAIQFGLRVRFQCVAV